MVTTLLTVTLTCNQAIGLLHRLTKVRGLNEQQKTEIVEEVLKVVPHCPVRIVKNGN